jgi:hypothetical protein
MPLLLRGFRGVFLFRQKFSYDRQEKDLTVKKQDFRAGPSFFRNKKAIKNRFLNKARMLKCQEMRMVFYFQLDNPKA